jgi:hypothetical protein
MMKIKYEDAAYIRRYKKVHHGEKYFCKWYLTGKNNNYGYMNLYIKWWAYLLMFIPIHIIKAIACIWDGGLKEFAIEPRCAIRDNIVGLTNDGPETEFGRFKEVWDKYESN